MPKWQESPPAAPVERPVTLYLNDEELVTLQMTPAAFGDWAIGFLFGEGLLRDPNAVSRMAFDEERGLVWIDLPQTAALERATGRKRYLTAGCGKGTTFSSMKDAMQLKPVTHSLEAEVAEVLSWVKEMQQNTPLYAETGGVHAAALKHVRTDELIVREDIGRHNALDKAIGAALRAGWNLSGAVALTSGRISYEAASKLGRAGIGIGASLTAATDQAIRLASHLGIDLIGYARSPNHMVIYTGGRRLLR